MKKCFLSVITVVAITVTGLCQAFPEPDIVPEVRNWTLDVLYAQPQQISIAIPNCTEPQRYWYTILTLTNNEQLGDADFYPACALMTDTFQIVPAERNIRKAVYDNIKFKHQGKYPFLQPIDFADNKILQGADNTIDIAIIWQDFDPKAKSVTLFISGLSNETVAIDHPTAKDKAGDPVKVYLRKTLALEYAIGGDEKLRAKATLVFKSKKWVMR